MIRWLAERCSDEQLQNSGLERKSTLAEFYSWILDTRVSIGLGPFPNLHLYLTKYAHRPPRETIVLVLRGNINGSAGSIRKIRLKQISLCLYGMHQSLRQQLCLLPRRSVSYRNVQGWFHR